MKQEDWIRTKLERLLTIGKSVNDEEIKNQYAEYTTLKLISILYYKTTFLNVVKKNEKARKYYDGAVYVDLFAGSGLVELKETADIIAGSPICALSNTELNFDFAVCIEKDKKKIQALESRLLKIIPQEKFKIIQGDCNKVIEYAIQVIRQKFKNPILFTFVDPEGMEIKMKTLKTLNDSFTAQDFMINVGAQGVLRVKGKLDRGDTSTEATWNEYWGEENAEALLYQIAEGKSVEEKYKEKISEVLGKKLGETIPIKGIPGNIEYYILAYSRETRGDSKYTRSLTSLKNRIENEDKKSVRRMLDVITGRNKTLF